MKFVLELHCEAPDNWAPDDRSLVLSGIAEEADHKLKGIGASVKTWGLRGVEPSQRRSGS